MTNEFHHEIASLPKLVGMFGARGALRAVSVELQESFTTLERKITRVHFVLIWQTRVADHNSISNVHTRCVQNSEQVYSDLVTINFDVCAQMIIPSENNSKILCSGGIFSTLGNVLPVKTQLVDFIMADNRLLLNTDCSRKWWKVLEIARLCWLC